MKYIYWYTGWKETANDARIESKLESILIATKGYYYLVNAVLLCVEMFMPPYPRERYYRSDRYSGHRFLGYKNYFNYRHVSLRNIIERVFALLKKLFQILYAMPQYRPARQCMIVTTCCTLHNMIKTVTLNDEFIQVY